MRLFNNKLLMLRVIAASADAVLFYIGFMFVNQLAGGSKINIAFFIITALCGLFANFLPYNSFDKRRQSLVFGTIGLAVSLLSVILSSIGGFNLFALPVRLIALLFLYYRTYISYLANVLYVYTIESFYKSLGLLLVINVSVVFWSRYFGVISDELMRYTIFYIVAALYILTEVKNFRYVSKNENLRKTTFDLAATSIMIIVTIVMSIPKIFNIVTFPFVTVFQFVYGWIVKGILLITYPVARLFNYVFDLIPKLDQIGQTKPPGDGTFGVPDNMIVGNENSAVVQLIGKALAFIFMLIICAYAIYLLYRFINRINRTEEQEDFDESKEFILRSDKQKKVGLFKKFTGSMRKAVDSISFMLTANNGDKLRGEYKAFVQRLYNKKIIENYNYTAQDILNLMLSHIPSQKAELISITEIYEEVRYGVKQPEDSELKSFRKNIVEISKNLQQMQ